MRSVQHAIRVGFSRGWIETKNQLASWDEMSFNTVFALGFAAVLFFQRNSTVPGTDESLAATVLPSMLGMMAAWAGVLGIAGMLVVEREDGTLLRLKAAPQGMVGYLVGKIVMLSLTTVATLAIIVGAGLILVPELLSAGAAGWLMALGIVTLGFVATLPWGALIGSLVKNPQAAFGLSMVPLVGLAAISGIFYPITAMAGWVQGIAQAFPVYWLGHGMRAVLTPDAEAAEIGGSWRVLEMLGVLGVWAVVGLLITLPILRRMARRESGSAMEERREAAMQRVG